MKNSVFVKAAKFFKIIKCPKCGSSNVEQGTIDEFIIDKCFDCGLEYTTPLRNRVSFLLFFFWTLISVPLYSDFFLYKGQPDYQVWLFIAGVFLAPFIAALIVQRSKPYELWDEAKAKSDKIKYWAILIPNFLIVFAIFQYVNTSQAV